MNVLSDAGVAKCSHQRTQTNVLYRRRNPNDFPLVSGNALFYASVALIGFSALGILRNSNISVTTQQPNNI